MVKISVKFLTFVYLLNLSWNVRSLGHSIASFHEIDWFSGGNHHEENKLSRSKRDQPSDSTHLKTLLNMVLDSVSTAATLKDRSELLDCVSISFTSSTGVNGTVIVIPVVGTVTCLLDDMLTKLCTSNNNFGIAELLVGTFSLVFYVLYRLCFDFYGFIIFGLLGLDFYNNQCLLYYGPSSLDPDNTIPDTVNYTNLEDILVVILIGAYKLLDFILTIVPLKGIVVKITSAIGKIQFLDLLTQLGEILFELANLLNIQDYVVSLISPSSVIALAIGYDPDSNYTVDNFPVLGYGLEQFLFDLAVGLAVLLEILFDGLLCPVMEDCSIGQVLGCLATALGTGVPQLLAGLAETLGDLFTFDGLMDSFDSIQNIIQDSFGLLMSS